MKTLSIIAALFVSIVCLAAQAQQQSVPAPTPTPTPTPTNLDIILEGPWILYIEHKLFSPGAVLIALSPDVSDQSRSHIFHYPYISMGDGYPFKGDIFCLLLNGKCGSINNNQTLRNDGYDTAVPLSVSATQTWDWRYAVTHYGSTALILPMPDTYSNDETWPMRFGSSFDSGGNGYNEQHDTPKHSIGVMLHYTSGISYADIYRCDFSQQTALNNCALNIVMGHQLNNTGTLRIVMKAPDDSGNDVCDLHVRSIYPQMLRLVDGDNGLIKVIDPARSITAEGKGSYDDNTVPTCLDKDKAIQGSLPPANNPYKLHGQRSIVSPNNAHNIVLNLYLSDQLMRIVGSLRAIPTIPKEDASLPDNIKNIINKSAANITNHADDIDKASTALQGKALPRMSQLLLIKLALQASQKTIRKLNIDIEQAKQEDIDKEKNLSIDNLLELVRKIKKNQAKAAADVPTKDGKDCRAPIMLVTQP